MFDGTKKTPYKFDDKPNPLSVYGASKLAGERVLTLIQPNNSSIIRTSWLYSYYGNNFVKTIINLISHKEHLSVISDQIGTPTNANRLAHFVWQLVDLDTLSPIYHWSDLGSTSWYDFAIFIQEVGLNQRLLKRKITIDPIPSSDYPSLAKRPLYSVLDTSASQSILTARDWREELADFMKEVKTLGKS